jgi:hypothetical protein
MARKLGEERKIERRSAIGPVETSLLLLLRLLPMLRGKEPDRARVSLALVLPVAVASSPASSYSAPPLDVEPRLALNMTPPAAIFSVVAVGRGAGAGQGKLLCNARPGKVNTGMIGGGGDNNQAQSVTIPSERRSTVKAPDG